MARGWESKSVEQQQDEARSASKNKRTPLSPTQIAALQKLKTLELSKNRIRQQLQATSNPRHLQMLESALADLEKQIAALNS
jgi:hypothetical protein